MTTLAILQARTTSSRLPGKVLLPILGKPMILHQLERVMRSRALDQVVLATSIDPSDDELAALCSQVGYPVFRGDLQDVLARYQACAVANGCDTVVRLTGDCPLSDPAVIDEIVDAFHAGQWDYLSNSADEKALTVPDGCDVEVFRRELLDQAAAQAVLPSEREHVTPWMRRPDMPIRSGHYRHQEPTPFYRLTVDDPRDFALVNAVFEALAPEKADFDLADVIAFLERNPVLAHSNLDTVRNEGYLRSVAADA
ncbi:MAG: spore coat protein [Cyanobacteria bacterium K_DeepCast_35m_m2_023]|nr:spore coat protein [Cyanobacteria bacterium K_DeepCast_35m_m2_023]